MKTLAAQIKVKDVMKQIALGFGLAVVADAIVELTRVPVLNDTGLFGNAKVSNFEILSYSLSSVGIVAGIADVGVGRGVVSFSKESIWFFTGFMLGVYFYEHSLAGAFGIRKYNPYEMVGDILPKVIPADADIPFIDTQLPQPLGSAPGPAF